MGKTNKLLEKLSEDSDAIDYNIRKIRNLYRKVNDIKWKCMDIRYVNENTKFEHLAGQLTLSEYDRQYLQKITDNGQAGTLYYWLHDDGSGYSFVFIPKSLNYKRC